MTVELPPVDLVVFCAHPDDAELTCGGTLLVAKARGWRTAVVDLTRGEMGTRGTPEIRAKESDEAAKVLGLAARANLGLPDCGVRDTDEARRAVVRAIRQMRPRIAIAPPWDSDHHPDHMAAGDLLRKCFYLCGIAKYVDLPPWRPRALLHYAGSRVARPSIIVDVSAVMEDRRKAIRCHASQVGPRTEGEPATRIGHPEFLGAVECRLRYFGWMIGVSFGEAFTMETPIPAADIVGLFDLDPWGKK